MTSDLIESMVPVAADAAPISKLAPADAAWYAALAEGDTLLILWEFLRQSVPYRMAYRSCLVGSEVPKSGEVTRLAHSFGLRAMMSPDTTPAPAVKCLLPILAYDRLSPRYKGTSKKAIIFDDAQHTILQIRHALWMMQCRSQQISNGPTYPRRTREYTNRRLTFLLRVLHCKLSGLSPTDSAALLSDMRLEWDDEKRSGRKRTRTDYVAKDFNADLKAAELIRAEKLMQLMHEARVSRYIAPDQPWPL